MDTSATDASVVVVDDVNMDEERFEIAQREVAMFWDFGSDPEVRDGCQSRQVTMPSKQEQRPALHGGQMKEYCITGENVAVASGKCAQERPAEIQWKR